MYFLHKHESTQEYEYNFIYNISLLVFDFFIFFLSSIIFFDKLKHIIICMLVTAIFFNVTETVTSKLHFDNYYSSKNEGDDEIYMEMEKLRPHLQLISKYEPVMCVKINSQDYNTSYCLFYSDTSIIKRLDKVISVAEAKTLATEKVIHSVSQNRAQLVNYTKGLKYERSKEFANNLISQYDTTLIRLKAQSEQCVFKHTLQYTDQRGNGLRTATVCLLSNDLAKKQNKLYDYLLNFIQAKYLSDYPYDLFNKVYFYPSEIMIGVLHKL